MAENLELTKQEQRKNIGHFSGDRMQFKHRGTTKDK